MWTLSIKVLRYMNSLGQTPTQEALLANYIIQKVVFRANHDPDFHIFS